ncbi:MAG TPA: 30S ribosomal protein S6 [Candidatus Saccharimonadia bacterium]|nr:30S ribosomal protein S6 [Candidatus Saccharimonadia bacterium]
MNRYEVTVLYDPALEVDLTKGEQQVLKIFATNKAKVIDSDNWGKRKLAYKIKNQDYAIYVFYTVELPSSNVSKVDTTLNITDEVIRHLIVKPDYKARDAAEAERTKKAKNRREDESTTESEE